MGKISDQQEDNSLSEEKIDRDKISDLPSRELIFVCLLWASVIFAIDLSVPSDMAIAVPYIGLVLLGLWLPHMFYIPLAAMGATVLTLIGFLNASEENASLMASNRLIALLAIWISAVLCYSYKRGELALKLAHEKLNQRVEELQILNEKFKSIAKTDPLTELPNRRGMNELLEKESFRFKRNHKPFCLILCDIDHFKKINDELGHDAGDQALIQIADVMRRSSRRTDVFCRWGGEEFLALLPETDLNGGVIFAEKLRSIIANENFFYGVNVIPVTMSFGVSVYDKEDMDLKHCVQKADEFLYQAKSAGRNRVISFESREVSRPLTSVDRPR